MTATYQMIRTDANGVERICIGGDIADTVFTEQCVNSSVSVMNRQFPEFKYTSRKLTDDRLVKMSSYDTFCLGFGQVAVPVVGGVAGLVCIFWLFKIAFKLTTWAIG